MIGLLRTSRTSFVALGVLALAGCGDGVLTIDGHSGVPLEQLAVTGKTIGEVTLLGPDTVHVVHGEKPSVTVAGDPRAVDALRFVLTDGKLGISRKANADVGTGTAIVTVTTAAVDHLIMAGSGTISSDRLNGSSLGITIGGSGHIDVKDIAAGKLDVEVMGTGTVVGSGHADRLELSIAGTGTADLAGLKVDQAAIEVAGTGDGTVASDGKVTGSVVGTGTVTVHGKANCNVSVTGTGKVICQP